jgi:hypothetical protein
MRRLEHLRGIVKDILAVLRHKGFTEEALTFTTLLEEVPHSDRLDRKGYTWAMERCALIITECHALARAHSLPDLEVFIQEQTNNPHQLPHPLQ